MTLKMKQAEFIALSACSMTLTALGIDIMLPAFGAIREHFGLPPESTAAAQIISFFFMGQVAQIIFGTLSDRYGRIAILRVGFPLYIIGGLVAAVAPNLEMMLAARFVAGMGASAVLTTTLAGVRDRFVGDEMARIMSLVFTIFLFTPVLAPFLGMVILKYSSWQMVFLTPPIFAVLVFLWSLRMEESLPKDRRISLDWTGVTTSILTVLKNRTFLRYTGITTLLFSALSSYVASSEHIIGEIYGEPEMFVWIFGSMGLLMSMCSLANSRLSAKFGAKRSIRGLLIAYVTVGASLMVITLVFGDPPGMVAFFTCISMMMALNLAIEPNCSALALEPLGNVAGIAAAIYGTIFFTVGSLLGSIISWVMVDGVTPLVVGYFVAGGVAVWLEFGRGKG
ncbi:MAG TPA: MFS transporter [Cyclobacteriaceae bacterium]|nr:MFS transporter [Cyclobacteriaceae bacterium]